MVFESWAVRETTRVRAVEEIREGIIFKEKVREVDEMTELIMVWALVSATKFRNPSNYTATAMMAY